MRYEILGEIRVTPTDVPLTFTRKCETLLAVLLVRANHAVSAVQLINEIWGEEPPRQANSALYVYVSHLRKLLRTAGRETPIVTRSRGYMLRVESGELDVDDFGHFADHGQTLFRSGRYEESAEALVSALRLWRGSAFGDLTGGPIVHAYSTWLEESRLQCLDLFMETELLRGRHREIIGRLYALITEYPLREKFYQHLMLALYRSDRRAEALEVYRTAATWLRREVGIDPCQALRDLHQSILLGDMQPAPCPTA
jgi:SARP family transcriptional regulator, regulator of embCAB operon